MKIFGFRSLGETMYMVKGISKKKIIIVYS